MSHKLHLKKTSVCNAIIIITMYIKSVVLDGFKSYGRRTEITGFDPQFTAVTGLNGSGKSNIIDSICFVLGITNLTNVSFFIYLIFYLSNSKVNTVCR